MVALWVQNLRHKMQDRHRSQVTTCVIVDYQMGYQNGLDWCQKIKNPLVQKILLTGVADEQVGIEALNNGWIHQYVRKQDPKMVEKLLAATQRAQLQSFSKLTEGLLFTITQCAEDSALLDPKFINIEAMGSFLMVDKYGKQSCLFVQTQAKADSGLDLMKDWIKDSQVKIDLRNNKKIICCPAPHNFVTPRGANYKPYLFPAHKLEGEQVYYLAITPNLFGNE
ncbi:MAG: hypothetical protein WCK49_11025, partial [Myxococcaceae bacterium]